MQRIPWKLEVFVGLVLAIGTFWQALIAQPGWEGRSDLAGLRALIGVIGPLAGGVLLVNGARRGGGNRERLAAIVAIAMTVMAAAAIWFFRFVS